MSTKSWPAISYLAGAELPTAKGGELGDYRNIVLALATVQEATECPAAGTVWNMLQNKAKKLDLLELDRKTLPASRLLIDEHAHTGALDHPDGFA